MERLRIRFTRGDEVKFISHLDIMRLWERALNRAGIQIAYSEGFSPHPRLSLASPLAVGVSGDAELLDVFVARKVSPHWLAAAVNAQLPSGIEILDVRQVGINLPSLQSQVRFAEYLVEVDKTGGPEDPGAAIASLLSRESLPWYHERDTGRREYDLRLLIDDISLASPKNGNCVLAMKLKCDSNGSGRPEQVTLALGFPQYPLSIRRTKLILNG